MDLREVREFIKDSIGIIITFVAVILFFTLVLSVQSITGNSMHPNYKSGDFVLVSKSLYKMGKIKRFDVVNVLDDEGKFYIKRVIGLPGDNIYYLNNMLFINGEPYQEPFLDNILTNNFMLEDVCKDTCIDDKIPDGMYLVLGDNRSDSLDSRVETFGLRPKSSIKGKVLLKIWSTTS